MPFTKGDPNINRTGKNRGSYSFIPILKEKLREAIDEGGKTRGVQVIETLLEMAIKKGNIKALQEVLRYIDGMPKQNMKVEGDLTISGLLDKLKQNGDTTEQRAEGDGEEPAE